MGTERVQSACRDCKRCTNSGFAELGRKLSRGTVGVSTFGMSELAFKVKKTCRLCGHQMSLHGETATPAPSLTQAGPPSGGQQPSSPDPHATPLSIPERLAKADELLAAGVITANEHAVRRAAILDEL